jgi:short-subunit dehydrogenase
MQKKIVIVGATSGMGEMVAKMFIEKGYKVGVGARREEKLIELKNINKDNVEYEVIDVIDDKSSESLLHLINKLGGMDEFFLASGVGYENEDLDLEKEIHTMQVNALGFVRMVDTAFNYFKAKWWWTYLLYHFYCRNKRSWCCTFVFFYKKISKLLYYLFGTTISYK